jgi:hypothetical protein
VLFSVFVKKWEKIKRGFGDVMGRGVFSRLLSQIFHNSDTVGRHIPSLVRMLVPKMVKNGFNSVL